MDVNQAAKQVILSYCEFLLDLRDHHSLAEDMRTLLYSLPDSVRQEIQQADFKGKPKGSPRPEDWDEW
jgi:hypothetical protein|tara:strand:- start:332 stop:535 length:204 start_codon:yes stop_codon:yes gene_type:complete